MRKIGKWPVVGRVGSYFTYEAHAVKRLKGRVLGKRKLDPNEAKAKFEEMFAVSRLARVTDTHEYYFTRWPINATNPKRFVLVFLKTNIIPVLSSVWTMEIFANMIQSEGPNRKWFLRPECKPENDNCNGNGHRKKR